MARSEVPQTGDVRASYINQVWSRSGQLRIKGAAVFKWQNYRYGLKQSPYYFSEFRGARRNKNGGGGITSDYS